jgi:GT2 family glycosyltransferase
MLIKRGVIETIGVQDDRLFFGMDDVGYSLRASRRGWKNLVAYDAVVYHAGSQSVTPNSGLQVYYIFRNALQLRTQNFPWYKNLGFFTYFAFRYVMAGSLYRWITRKGRVNLGVYYALLGFFRGQTGECSHTSALSGPSTAQMGGEDRGDLL